MKHSLLVLLLMCGVAAADDTVEAEQAYNEGQRAFDAARYSDAIIAWQRSYTLSNEPGLLYNLAQAYRLSGDCATAAEHYRRFIALDPTSAQRPLAERFEIETRPCARHDAVTAPGVTQPTQPHVTSPPVVQVAPTRSPSRLKTRLGFGFGIGGAALVGLGLYYGHRVSALGDEVTAACATTCNWGVYGPKEAAGRSAETRQYVFASVGVVAILGGGALYWLGVRETRLVVVPHADGAALTWSRTW